MTVLVTGAAGFIGYHVADALLRRGERVVGIDCLDPYYDVTLKEARLARLAALPGFTAVRGDIADTATLDAVVTAHGDTSAIVHLAAQAGVRYSLENPRAYVRANVVGHLEILEAARRLPGLRRLVYASTSSVYGANEKRPYSITDRVDRPVSLYAATKRANELTAHVYHHLYGMHCTGLRFFTVYGPWGRPDMAYFSFTKAILEGKPIDVFNHGRMKRDFTYVSDVVGGVLSALDRNSGYEIFNIGNCRPETLGYFIATIEAALGKKAKKRMRPIQPGDVPATWADIKKSTRLLGFRPTTDLKTGVGHFVRWYRSYYS